MEILQEELEELKKRGLYRLIPDIIEKFDNKLIINNKDLINFASNDYLNISTNQLLRNEFLSDNKSLLSSASARLLSGSSMEFKELEHTIAALFKKESCLIFNTGYQCNLGIISTLCSKGDIIFSDKLNHASIIDGMRLSEGDFIRFKHLDYEHLESLLKTKRCKYRRALIISESIFSMDGDTADIDKLIELKNKYNCMLMIDEAHAFCSWGDALWGLSGNKDVDIITATFGKALGSFGAFCVSSKNIIDYLTCKARSFIFSTSIPPINVAWSNWLLTEKKSHIINQKQKLYEIANKTHKLLNTNGTHIIPIIIGSNEDTIKISEVLTSQGYYIPAIRPPTVPTGTARLRISLTANTNIDDIKTILLSLREFLHQ